MKMKSFVKGAVVTGAVVLILGSCVFAGTTMQEYQTNVGWFNGSGYSKYQTKIYGGEDGFMYSNAVGGNYVVDVRMHAKVGSGAWVRGVNDNRYYCVPSTRKQKEGTQVRLKFSNKITTPVTVEVVGRWKSN